MLDTRQGFATAMANPTVTAICNGCLKPLDLTSATTVNVGDFAFHAGCAPVCVSCGRRLQPNTLRRSTEYQVLDSHVEFLSGLGYYVALKVCCCGSCYDGMLHDEPSALA